MAKAQFHKNQRIYVKPVGTWAIIERVLPQWAKGLDEPIRVHYDVGLGRDFTAEELQAETATPLELDTGGQSWRLIRVRNKWQSEEDSAHHPFPGTFPTVVTNEKDWGGWRVPGAEYDLDPLKIETQARIILNALPMLNVIQGFVEYVDNEPENVPDQIRQLAKTSGNIIKAILDTAEPEEDDVQAASEYDDVSVA